jgi:hypothetical protein
MQSTNQILFILPAEQPLSITASLLTAALMLTLLCLGRIALQFPGPLMFVVFYVGAQKKYFLRRV